MPYAGPSHPPTSGMWWWPWGLENHGRTIAIKSAMRNSHRINPDNFWQSSQWSQDLVTYFHQVWPMISNDTQTLFWNKVTCSAPCYLQVPSTALRLPAKSPMLPTHLATMCIQTLWGSLPPQETLLPLRHLRWWSRQKCQWWWKAKGLTIDENSESLKSPETCWSKMIKSNSCPITLSDSVATKAYCKQIMRNQHAHWSFAGFNRQVYDFMIILARFQFAVFALEPFPLSLSLSTHFICPFPSLSGECFLHLVCVLYHMQQFNPRCFVATCTFPRVIEACLAHSFNSTLYI